MAQEYDLTLTKFPSIFIPLTPQKELKRYQIKALREFLIKAGVN
jgi:hypothetical protein